MSTQNSAERTYGDRFEETLIAILLGGMTVITFANVVARWTGWQGGNILWALEATVYLFAWMVLLGASYAVKKNFHIGVDVFVRLLPPAARKSITFIALFACLAFSLLMLKGSWDYWWKFATERAWFEVNDIPMPAVLNQFMADWLNEGERYEKIPRLIPYFVLPLSMGLLTLRFIQAGVRILRDEQELLVESHDSELDDEEAASASTSTIDIDSSKQGL